jgi:hypothetical protein
MRRASPPLEMPSPATRGKTNTLGSEAEQRRSRCRGGLRRSFTAGLAAVLVATTFVASAQVGGKPITGGNPTPGTPQPDPPNLSDRITLTGCLRPAPQSGAASEAPDTNTPSSARFALSNAQRVDRHPPGTGGSELAQKTFSSSYRLEGLDSQFSPFANTKVEISGEIKARAAGEPADGAIPILIVEFIQKTASTCDS